MICGKAGAGKSTHARLLAKEYRAAGQEAAILDGDVFRHICGNNDYSNAGRKRNLKGLAEEAAIIEGAGRVCIVAVMAPKREWRDMMRDMWQGRGRLVYLPGGSLWEGTEYELPSDDEF